MYANLKWAEPSDKAFCLPSSAAYRWSRQTPVYPSYWKWIHTTITALYYFQVSQLCDKRLKIKQACTQIGRAHSSDFWFLKDKKQKSEFTYDYLSKDIGIT